MHLFHYISLHLFHHISGSYRDKVGSDLAPETGVKSLARNGSALKVIVICAALLAALGPQPAFSHSGSASSSSEAAARRAAAARKANAEAKASQADHALQARADAVDIAWAKKVAQTHNAAEADQAVKKADQAGTEAHKAAAEKADRADAAAQAAGLKDLRKGAAPYVPPTNTDRGSGDDPLAAAHAVLSVASFGPSLCGSVILAADAAVYAAQCDTLNAANGASALKDCLSRRMSDERGSIDPSGVLPSARRKSVSPSDEVPGAAEPAGSTGRGAAHSTPDGTTRAPGSVGGTVPTPELPRTPSSEPRPAKPNPEPGTPTGSRAKNASAETQQRIALNQARQDWLLNNQQEQLETRIVYGRSSKSEVNNVGEKGREKVLRTQGNLAESITRDTLRHVEGSIVTKDVMIGTGTGTEIDNIVVRGDKHVYVESKLTISSVNKPTSGHAQRMINQLTNAVKISKPEDTVVLHVTREPTDLEIQKLRKLLGDDVFSKVKIVSKQTDLFDFVTAAKIPCCKIPSENGYHPC